eukprot:SAG11_NODE_1950_length_4013_cov_4.004854_4_plen_87_part_00
MDRLVEERWETIKVESADCKVWCQGRDRDGRPILWLRSANERTFDNKGLQCGNLVNLVYNIERCIAAMAEGGDGKWLLIIVRLACC